MVLNFESAFVKQDQVLAMNLCFYMTKASQLLCIRLNHIHKINRQN